MPKITPDFVSGPNANTITVKNGERSSRFRVDLPALGREEARRQRELSEPLISKANRKLRRYFSHKDVKDDEAVFIPGAKELSENLLGPKVRFIESLTFYPLWRLLRWLIKMVFRASYYAGYAALYIIRFIILAFKYLASFGREKIRQRQARPAENSIVDIAEKEAMPVIVPDEANQPEVAEAVLAGGIKSKGKTINAKTGVLAYLKKKLRKEKSDREFDGGEGKQTKSPGFNPASLLPRKVNAAPAMYFMIALLIFTLPLKAMTYYQGFSDLKGRVLGATETAISDIGKAAGKAANQDFAEAGSDFLSASNNFSLAQKETDNINGLLQVLARIIPSENIKIAGQADKILKAGGISALMGAKFSEILSILNSDDLDIANYLETFARSSNELSAMGNEFNRLVNGIDENSIPPEYRETFKLMKEKAGLLSRSLTELKEIMSLAVEILGYKADKRYLMVFQNNTELRASGGFIGSYALIDFRSGEIKNLEVPGGGSYDTEAGLYDMVASPQPLSLVSPRWYFWDANWWPDWPLSAEKLMWFYEKSNGPTVDGVISLTPTVLEALLKVVGEIDLSAQYGVKVRSENFWKITQTIAEEKPAADSASSSPAGEAIRHEPKKIIGDLFSALIEELPKRLDREKLFSFVSELERLGREKQILFYFVDPETERSVSNFGWGGEVADTNWDYLMVINTNIAGAKTDREIVEYIDHASKVQSDGSIINTVTIKRIHTAQKGEEFTGVRNVDWMRLYVPAGSELISATGFTAPHGRYFEEAEASWQTDPDILAREGQARRDEASDTLVYQEFNKTVFANWSMIEPGEIGKIVVKYKLPFRFGLKEDQQDNWQTLVAEALNPGQKDMLPYALYVQKQPGSIGSNFRSSLAIPDAYKAVWSYGEGLEDISGGWELEGKLDTDRFWAIIASPE